MIEVRDCYKNVKLHKKNIGLFPYHIHNHPIKDVHDEVEIIYVDIYTDDGERYHYEKCVLGDMVEADKHCVYVKGDTCEGKPIIDMTVRTKYFYDFEVPDSTENIPLNEAQIGLKLNEMPNCVFLLESLENNDLKGILTTFEPVPISITETPYLDSLNTWTYSTTGPVQSHSVILSDEDILELKKVFEEHGNNE